MGQRSNLSAMAPDTLCSSSVSRQQIEIFTLIVTRAALQQSLAQRMLQQQSPLVGVFHVMTRRTGQRADKKLGQLKEIIQGNPIAYVMMRVRLGWLSKLTGYPHANTNNSTSACSFLKKTAFFWKPVWNNLPHRLFSHAFRSYCELLALLSTSCLYFLHHNLYRLHCPGPY